MAKTIERTARLTMDEFETKWERMSASLSKTFRLKPHEEAWFASKPVARLIAAIPMFAGCNAAERTAVAHLSIYLASVKETKPYFNATVEDDEDVLTRLRLIMNYSGGDTRIIDKGIAAIALHMLDDYLEDVVEDRVLGKHNPVSSKAFNVELARHDLEQRVNQIECRELDQLIADLDVKAGFWSVDSGRGFWAMP